MKQIGNLNILTIGNSFTDSLSLYFQQVVESAGCALHFERANHGGCELHRHWRYISDEESDWVYRMYQDSRFKLREILGKLPWDVVTMQQASHFSWRPETYQPFANNIRAVVEKYAPGAEIVIQQTWAYRADDPRIRPGGQWRYDANTVQLMKGLGIDIPAEPMTIDQAAMQAGLENAYAKLAKEFGARVIPTGHAVKLAREHEPFKFQNYDPSLMETLRWPDLPPQAGDVVGSCRWGKDPETGELRIGRDTIHLNARGQYLQACVWFAYLYGRKCSEVSFVPQEISDADAAFLRDMAQKGVDSYRQPARPA